MRKFLLTLLSLLLCIVSMTAQYSLHSASTGVKVKSGTNISLAKVGTTLHSSDRLIIPDGGKVEIINSGNKKIYASTACGEISVFDLVINANKSAQNHASTVANRLNFGKSASSKTSSTVFREAGMVRRSMAQFDPEAIGMEMDAATMGKYIAAKLVKGAKIESNDSIPIAFSHSMNVDCGLEFQLTNNLEYPIYYNVVKVTCGENPTVELSRLGQPAGCYALLPQQAVMRRDLIKVPEGERHLLIMTPCHYDIDKVLDEARRALDDRSLLTSLPEQLPVYAGEL